jgi:hypothetical protein
MSVCLTPKRDVFVKEEFMSFGGWDLIGERLLVILEGHFTGKLDLHFD